MKPRRRATKRDRFVEEYLVDLNATQAAIRAGYSKKTAQQISTLLMADPEVAAKIQAAKEARSAETKVTAARVVEEMAVVAFSDIGDIIDTDGLQPKLKTPIPEKVRRAISSIKVKRVKDGEEFVDLIEFKLWDKNAALAQLGKHTGAVRDKVDVEGDVTLTVVEKIVDGASPAKMPEKDD